MTNLTSQRTKTKRVQERPPTNFTNKRNSFGSTFRLRSLIQKQNPGTVYYISLHPTYIQHLLNLGNPHHIMIRRSPYLRTNTTSSNHHNIYSIYNYSLRPITTITPHLFCKLQSTHENCDGILEELRQSHYNHSQNKPVLHDDLYALMIDNTSKKNPRCSPNKTCCIRSARLPHESGRDGRSSSLAVSPATAAPPLPPPPPPFSYLIQCNLKNKKSERPKKTITKR